MFLICVFAHLKSTLSCARITKMLDLLSGIFTRSLSLCFFSCSISLSPSLVSNWVSLIYSTMLAWPSLCWSCKKYQAGCLTGTLPHTHTHPAFPVQAVNDCVSKLEVSQPVAPVALTAEPQISVALKQQKALAGATGGRQEAWGHSQSSVSEEPCVTLSSLEEVSGHKPAGPDRVWRRRQRGCGASDPGFHMRHLWLTG